MREHQQPPTTETMNASETRQQFSAVLNRVYRKETGVLVEKSGIPVAAIVSADDLARLNGLDEGLAARRQIVEDMRAPFKDVPPEEIERESAQALAQARAELRAERGRCRGQVISTVTGVATHPEDDLILATAVSAAVDSPVTGDRHLLKLGA